MRILQVSRFETMDNQTGQRLSTFLVVRVNISQFDEISSLEKVCKHMLTKTLEKEKNLAPTLSFCATSANDS